MKGFWDSWGKLQYSKHPMYKQIPFQKHIRKSNLFMSPKKLA